MMTAVVGSQSKQMLSVIVCNSGFTSWSNECFPDEIRCRFFYQKPSGTATDVQRHLARRTEGRCCCKLTFSVVCWLFPPFCLIQFVSTSNQTSSLIPLGMKWWTANRLKIGTIMWFFQPVEMLMSHDPQFSSWCCHFSRESVGEDSVFGLFC